MINSRFAVAVHLLTLMGMGCAHKPGRPLTSEMAAESVNTNPVVIRRILGLLRHAGLVSSQPGPSGGWFLKLSPEEITLHDIYRAVEDERLFSLHHRRPNDSCLVGHNICDTLDEVFAEAESAMEDKLAERSVADVIAAILLRAGSVTSG